MKVVLVTPPHPRAIDDKTDAPLTLLYLAAVCRADGHETRVLDLAFLPEDRWEEGLGYADVYGITVVTNRYREALKIRDVCKRINGRCTVIVGGPHPTAMPQETARDFDVIVRGEGDIVLPRLLRDGSPFPHVAERIPVTDLDRLPPPARDMLDLRRYDRRIGGKPATPVMTSRGCPFDCAFCGSRTMFGRARRLSADNVVSELRTVKAMGFDALYFMDDTFVTNRERLYPLLERIGKMGFVFRCNGRAGYNTYEDYERLKAAGCVTVGFGIESGSQRILDRSNKRVTVAQNVSAIRDAKRAGLRAKAFFVVGLPGETWETLEETKRFVDIAEPDSCNLSTFVPYPGCDIWRRPHEYGVKTIDEDWEEYYAFTGQSESGFVVQTDTYDTKTLREMRRDLKTFLTRRLGLFWSQE